MKLNLTVVGYIPNFNRRQSYDGFSQPVQEAIAIAPVIERVNTCIVRPIRAKAERILTNSQRYKAGVIKAWKKRNRGHKDVLLASTKLN